MEKLRKYRFVQGMGNSPAAVNYKTGEVFINKERLSDFSSEMWQWIMEHENAHVLYESGDELAADNLALNRALFAGASMKTLLKEIQGFLHFSSPQHKQRLLRLQKKALHISSLLSPYDYDFSVKANRIKAMSQIKDTLEAIVAMHTVGKDYGAAIDAASQLRDMATDPIEADFYEDVIDDLQDLENPVANADGRRHKKWRNRKNAFQLLNSPKQALNELEKKAAFIAATFINQPEKAIDLAKTLRNKADKPHLSHFFQEIVDDLKERHSNIAGAGLKGIFKKKDKSTGAASTPQTGTPAGASTNPPPRKKGPINTLLANFAANKERKNVRKDLVAQAKATSLINKSEAKKIKAANSTVAGDEEKKGKWADGLKAVGDLAGGIVGAIYPGTGPLIAGGMEGISQIVKGPVKDENGNVVENPSEAQIAAQMQAEMEAKAKEDAAAAKKKTTIWLIVGGVVTLVIGGVVYYFWNKSKKAQA